MTDTFFVPNGINGSNGEYLIQAPTPHEILEVSLGNRLPKEFLDKLQDRNDRSAANYGVPFGVEPENLSQTGWAVLFPRDIHTEIIQALRPLLDLRKEQTGPLYREFSNGDGYLPGDTANRWLARAPRSKGPGVCTCEKVPYYLLIVGTPEQIPFRFQYELSVNYAVGRIHFEELENYRNFANNVVRADEVRATAGRRALFFGPRNAGDAATRLSADKLVGPLSGSVKHPGWQIETCLADSATKETLKSQLFHSGPAPAFLFTASHGMGFALDDPRQQRHQGALLCQDWPGPLLHRGSIAPELYFSVDDLDDDMDLNGMIIMHFACFSAGTPRLDNFSSPGRPVRQLASTDFLSALPLRMLGMPKGAQAVVGHIERAWSYAFDWPGTQAELSTFESTLRAMMHGGYRVGHAMEFFSERFAGLSVALNSQLDDVNLGANVDERVLSQLWLASNDARNYLVLGDPAARLGSSITME
jgi:hypothetical protein